MHSTSITCKNKRKGVSTILGTLIFIGILFTSVIPMFLVMKQADNIYAQKMHEMEKLDQTRDMESIEVYAYPIKDEDQIKISIENVGVVPAEIVRVWINNTYNTTSLTIPSLDIVQLGPYDLNTFNGAFYEVKVATSAGKMYQSVSGKIYYEDGEWFSPQLGICVHIAVGFFGMGYFRCKISNTTWDSIWYESDFKFSGDVVHIFDIVIFVSLFM